MDNIYNFLKTIKYFLISPYRYRYRFIILKKRVSFFYNFFKFRPKVDYDDGKDAGEDGDDDDGDVVDAGLVYLPLALHGPSLMVLHPGWPQMFPSSVQLLRPQAGLQQYQILLESNIEAATLQSSLMAVNLTTEDSLCCEESWGESSERSASPTRFSSGGQCG